MFDPTNIPFLPSDLSEAAINAAAIQNIGCIRFGRRVRSLSELLKLYRITFDLQLAVAADFCVVPAGWVEHHGVRLPDTFKLRTEAQIKARLERMLHAPRAQDAVAYIREAASYLARGTGDKKLARYPLIDSPDTLARTLSDARSRDETFVDALMHGRLDLSLSMIAERQLKGLQREAATRLLIMMTRLWGLHDLQVIAARLHQSIYRPTGGFIEGLDAGPQSFQAWAKDPAKLAEMAGIASRLQRRRPGHVTPTDQEEEQRFSGFVTATPFKAMARDLGQVCGLSADDPDSIHSDDFTNLRALEKLLQRFPSMAASFGPAIAEGLSTKWDDGAPSGKNAGPKAVSHLSASAIRYGMDAHVALAHAIIAFIILSEQVPARVEQLLGCEVPLPRPVDVMMGHERVTFELMFAAYRAVFLRDPNHLRSEMLEMLPATGEGAKKRSPIFASNAAAKAWRQDYILGKVSTLEERLGRPPPLMGISGFKPDLKTGFGTDALKKAWAIIVRDREEGGFEFDPRFSPAFFERMYPPPDLLRRHPRYRTDRSTARSVAVASRSVMASPCRIIRFPEVLALTALSRSHLYRKMAKGTFPNRLKIGERAVGWRSTDVDNWLASPR